MDRRLAAIFAADVVGFSRLVEVDEEGAIRSLKGCREIIDELIGIHHGRVFGSAGDSVIAEFSSPVEAVRCAVAIQARLGALQASLDEERRMRFRIGINLGDVVADGDNLLGDSVNIAARLETLADPGGICLSQPVLDQIRKRLDLGYEYLGKNSVKNIAEPVHAYRVRAAPAIAGEITGKSKGYWKNWRSAALLVAIVLSAGVIAGSKLLGPRVETADLQKMAFPLPEKPSVAVMPFDNLSGDSDKDILIDGLVEEIITKLSEIPGLFVIARNSTFNYKGKPWTAQQVAEELGVRFVLEGSVRVDGKNSRFSAHLVDAVDGNQIWAESYDREIKDLLALQSEIAGEIVSEMDVNLVPDDRARLQRQTTASPEAYELFLRGQAAPSDTQENNLAKIRLYEEAVSLDPKFSAALAASSITHSMSGRLGWEDPETAYEAGEELANRAIVADNGYSGAYLALSTVHRFRGEFEESLALVEKALALAPNNAEAIMYKGRMLRVLRGRAEEAIPLIKSAMRLNPHYPADYVSQLGWAYFAAGMIEEAHHAALEYAVRQPNRDHAHWRLAMTYALLGKMDEARAEAAEAVRINPNRTISSHVRLAPYADSNPELMQLEIEAMRKAGFPE